MRMLVVATMICTALTASAQVETFSSGDRGHLIWEDGFEAGGWRATRGTGVSEGANEDCPVWYQSQMQGDYSGRVIDAPARAGEHAMRFEWRRANAGDRRLPEE